MELDSRKKTGWNDAFKQLCYAGGERDRPEESRRVERLSHLMCGNNRRCLPDGRKGMQSPEKIEDVKEKIHARARKML